MSVFLESLECKHRWEMINADIAINGNTRGNLYRCKKCGTELASLFRPVANGKTRAGKTAPKQTSRVQREKRKSVQR